MTTGELRRHNAITREGKKILDKADRCMNEIGPVLGVVDQNRRPRPRPTPSEPPELPVYEDEQPPPWWPGIEDVPSPTPLPGPSDPIPPQPGPRYPQPQPPGSTPIEGRVEKAQCTLKEFARLTEISQKQCPILLFRVRDPGRTTRRISSCSPALSRLARGSDLGVRPGDAWLHERLPGGDYRRPDPVAPSFREPSGSSTTVSGASPDRISVRRIFRRTVGRIIDLKLSFPYVVTFGAPIPAFENQTRYVHVEVEGNGDQVLRYVREFLPTSLLPHQVGPNHRVIQLRGGYSPFDTHWNNHFIYWTSDELSRYGVEGLGIPCPDIDYDSVLAYPVPRFRKRDAGEPPSFSGLKSVDEDVHSIGSWTEYWENADDS